MSFNIDTFFIRIQESVINQYVIERLSGQPLIGPNADNKHEESEILVDHLHRYNAKNISTWHMKRLMKIVRQSLQSNLQESSAMQITSDKKAKVAAQKIFNNVVKAGSQFIFLEDLMRFLREDEASETIRLFDGAENEGISKHALENWVVNIFRERKALSLSLDDTKTAVNKLHKVFNYVVALIFFVLCLLILRVATTPFFVFLASQIVLTVFVFGNTCKTMFEATIFLFVIHPFDIGDRVEIDGEQMLVEEMNILTTIFLRLDNNMVIYFNNVLASKSIKNFGRSPDMGDTIEFCIDISTPTLKIVKMKEKIISYVDGKSDHWRPAPMIFMKDMEELNRIRWSVWVSHTMNFQDMDERWMRRGALFEKIVKLLGELDIECQHVERDPHVTCYDPTTNQHQSG